jgi:serine/threonine protein kinase
VTRNGEDVAVKKLKLCDMNLNDKQFQTELNNLRKLEHQNIVRILGYCYETEKKPCNMPDGSKIYLEETHRALCFEYLDNGSLQEHLSGMLTLHSQYALQDVLCICI